MRHLPVLALASALTACGGATPSTTLSATCDGSRVLAGATSIDVVVDANRSTSLSFPDPVNTGKTGTIPIKSRCTIVAK